MTSERAQRYGTLPVARSTGLLRVILWSPCLSLAHVLLRCAIRHEVVVIRKSRYVYRIAEDARVFDFELSPEDVSILDGIYEGAAFNSEDLTP